MKFYQVKKHNSNHILAYKVKEAITFKDRLIGLMFKDKMDDYDGLLLEPCKSIHNFFVRFPIDVIFLNKDNEIVKIIKSFKPWRITNFYFKAVKVLELKAGTIQDHVKEGDLLEVTSV